MHNLQIKSIRAWIILPLFLKWPKYAKFSAIPSFEGIEMIRSELFEYKMLFSLIFICRFRVFLTVLRFIAKQVSTRFSSSRPLEKIHNQYKFKKPFTWYVTFITFGYQQFRFNTCLPEYSLIFTESKISSCGPPACSGARGKPFNFD